MPITYWIPWKWKHGGRNVSQVLEITGLLAPLGAVAATPVFSSACDPLSFLRYTVPALPWKLSLLP